MIHNACIQIHPQIPQECLTETDMPPTKPNTPGYSHIDLGTKLFPLSQIPSLSLHVASPSSTLCCRVFPAPGLLYAGLGGPVWNVVRRRRGYFEGGSHADLKKKKEGGVLNCSCRASTPPLICRPLGYWGRRKRGPTGQSKGCKVMESQTHTLPLN